MEFLAPFKWIDQKIQFVVDWIAHTLLIVLGIKISTQRYTLMTILITSMVASHFFVPEKDRNLGVFIANLIVGVFLIYLQNRVHKIDQMLEDNGLKLPMDPMRIFSINMMKVLFTCLLIDEIARKQPNLMLIVNDVTWIIYEYLIRTPPTPPPTKQFKEVFSHSS